MILLTGSNGFIGTAIAEIMNENNITGIDIVPSHKPKHREVIGDISNKNFIDILKSYGNVDAIVHTVALISSAYCQRHPFEAFNVNEIGTLNMLELARKSDTSKFVYISSGGIYGSSAPDVVIDESRLPNPNGIYSVTKLNSEMAIREYCKSYSINGISLRITAPYGPRMNGSKFPFQIPDSLHRHTLLFAIKCANSKDIFMPVGGDHRVNYTYVNDIAEAVKLSLDSDIKGFEAFNIAGGKNYSISELGKAVSELCPNIKVSIGPGDLSKGLDENDPMISKLHINQGLFDISKAKLKLGYKPKFSIKEGMRALIQFIREQSHDRN